MLSPNLRVRGKSHQKNRLFRSCLELCQIAMNLEFYMMSIISYWSEGEGRERQSPSLPRNRTVGPMYFNKIFCNQIDEAMKWNTSQTCGSVHQQGFKTNSTTPKHLPSNRSQFHSIIGFSLFDLRYIPWSPPKWWVIVLKPWTSTGYFQASTGSIYN